MMVILITVGFTDDMSYALEYSYRRVEKNPSIRKAGSVEKMDYSICDDFIGFTELGTACGFSD